MHYQQAGGAPPGDGQPRQGGAGQPQVMYVQAPGGAQQQARPEPFLKGDQAGEDIVCLVWLIFCFPCSICCFLPYYQVRHQLSRCQRPCAQQGEGSVSMGMATTPLA